MMYGLLIVVVAVAAAHAMTFEDFKSTYGKTYTNSEEETYRSGVFAKNLQFIQAHNARSDASFTVAMNKFGDVTSDEFRTMMLKAPTNAGVYEGIITDNMQALPPSQDWRSTACIGPVANQGQCGAVWAVVAKKLIEDYRCLKHQHQFVALSQQDLLDCTPGTEGCNGGLLSDAFKYCVQKGIDTEASYPYSDRQGTCRHNESSVGAKCVKWNQVTPPGNETALTEVLAYTGPVACGINAGQTSFQFYSSGVYSDPSCNDQIDHVVINVGYGNQKGQDYYIIQNTWGTAWGMGGYMLIARNKHNMCGISSDAFWVTVQ